MNIKEINERAQIYTNNVIEENNFNAELKTSYQKGMYDGIDIFVDKAFTSGFMEGYNVLRNRIQNTINRYKNRNVITNNCFTAIVSAVQKELIDGNPGNIN